MKTYLTLLAIILLTFSLTAQNQHFNLGTGIGYDPTNSTFLYDGSNVGHYSLAWFAIPGSAEARMSAYGGIKFFTESTPRLSISKIGLVGIGTTTPDEALVVNGSVAFSYTNTGNSYSGIKRNGIKTEYYNGITGTPTNVIHEFTGVNKTIMSLTQGGNIGIGTTAPSSILDIQDNANIDVKAYSTNGGSSKFWAMNSAYSYGFGIDTDNKGHIFHNINSPTPTSTMTFQGNRVGIGTTSPATLLHVSDPTGGGNAGGAVPSHGILIGGESTGGVLNIGIDATGNQAPFHSWIQSRHKSSADFYNLALNPEGGNVGIGTNSPQATLHIKSDGNSTGTAFMVETTTWDNPEIKFKGITNQADIQYFDENNALYSVFRIGKNSNGAYMSFDDRTDPNNIHAVFKVTNGITYAKEVIVQTASFPDYVFGKEYELMSLDEVENMIENEGHLPNMPTESDIVENGMSLNEITILQQEKIEELTLYLIDLKKEVELLKAASNK